MAAGAAAKGADAAARARLDAFAEQLAGARSAGRQASIQLDYPGLPKIAFHDRTAFPWLPGLEGAAGEITAELAMILAADGDDLAPYIAMPPGADAGAFANLNGSNRWGAFHLIFDGRLIPWNARRAPATMAAIAKLPQPILPRRAPMATFSVLEPGARIPPHTGVANVRLIVHLGLITPPGCGLRVGGETRGWAAGEAFAFDDTIEHEAWNDGDRRRVVLICDVWNPLISEPERIGIAAICDALDAYGTQSPPRG